VFEGWAGELTPTVSPAGDRVHLALEVRRRDLRAEPAVRRLDDPVNGTVHLPDAEVTTVRADLGLADGETATLAAGVLPDGRQVVLDVAVRVRR
jgi:hypothetical protein